MGFQIDFALTAERLSGAVGREIQYVDVPPQAMMEALLNVGLPRWQVDGLIEYYAHYGRGEASTLATAVQDARTAQIFC